MLLYGIIDPSVAVMMVAFISAAASISGLIYTTRRNSKAAIAATQASTSADQAAAINVATQTLVSGLQSTINWQNERILKQDGDIRDLSAKNMGLESSVRRCEEDKLDMENRMNHLVMEMAKLREQVDGSTQAHPSTS